jgi:hypothetical protein
MFQKKNEELAGDAKMSAPPMKPFTKKGSHAPSKPPTKKT